MWVELFPTAKDPSWQESQSLGNPSKTPPTWQDSQSATAWLPVKGKPVARWSKVDKSTAFSSNNEGVSSTAANVIMLNGKKRVIARTTRIQHPSRLPPFLQSLFNATALKRKILLHYYERNLLSQRPKHANAYPLPASHTRKYEFTKRPARCPLFFFCSV